MCTEGQWSPLVGGAVGRYAVGPNAGPLQVVFTDGREGLRSQPVSVWFGTPLAMGWMEYWGEQWLTGSWAGSRYSHDAGILVASRAQACVNTQV